MNKEKEIEEMAEVIASGYLPRPVESQFDIFRFKPAVKALQKAGYGNVKQAVKEFAGKLKAFIVGNTCVSDDDINKVYHAIDNLITELYGADE